MPKVITTNLLTPWNSNTPLAATIGYFDGVHLGHQNLISQMVTGSKLSNLPSAIITFTHPAKFYAQDTDIKLTHTDITPLDAKIKHLTKLKPDYIIIIEVDPAMIKTSPQQFIKILKNNFKVTKLYLGPDFKFGSGGIGTINDLSAEIEVIPVKLEAIGQAKISSSQIKNYLNKGQISEAKKLLGYDYSIKGEVIEGQKQGRKIGFPTANFAANTPYVIPSFGVYKTEVTYNNTTYQSVTNIGIRPTFHGTHLVIETHILNFNQDIYGETIKLIFHQKLRDEVKFEGINQLITQINQDITTAWPT